MAQKPLPSLAAPLLCHFCFQHFAAQFSEHQKAAYTRYVLCAAISIPFFAHILPSRIFFSILYFFPLQIMHECAKEVRLRTFFALPNLCVCFLWFIQHFTRFPLYFRCNRLQHIQICTNCLNLCKILPQFLLDAGQVVSVLCTNCFVLVRMFWHELIFCPFN